MERIKSTKSYELYKYEYELFNSDEIVTFNLIDIDIIQKTVTLEVTNCGRLRPVTFALCYDYKNNFYFEYYNNKIYLEDFIYMED